MHTWTWRAAGNLFATALALLATLCLAGCLPQLPRGLAEVNVRVLPFTSAETNAQEPARAIRIEDGPGPNAARDNGR